MTTQYNNVICVQWMVRARFHGVGAEVIDKQNEEVWHVPGGSGSVWATSV